MSGIYQIICLINGRVYIGSSVQLKQRFNQHFTDLRRNVHFNIHLQRAFNKYGESNFEFEVLEYCTKHELIEREQFWLDRCGNIFNIRLVAESNLGLICSQSRKKKISNFWKGRKQSKETILKRSKALIGNKNSVGYQNNIKSVDQFSKCGKFIRTFSTMKEAAEFVRGQLNNISRCCLGLRNSHKGYIWQYSEGRV